MIVLYIHEDLPFFDGCFMLWYLVMLYWYLIEDDKKSSCENSLVKLYQKWCQCIYYKAKATPHDLHPHFDTNKKTPSKNAECVEKCSIFHRKGALNQPVRDFLSARYRFANANTIYGNTAQSTPDGSARNLLAYLAHNLCSVFP